MNVSNFKNGTNNPIHINFSVGYFLLSNITIITNLFLISIITLRRIRSLNSTIMASMCTVDILYATIYLYPRFAFPMSSRSNIYFCNILPKLGIAFIINLSFHLCLLSLDKYLSITRPFFYNNHATIGKGSLVICMSWIASLLIAFLPFFTFDNIHRSICSLYSENLENDRIYLLFVFIILFFMPLTSSIIVYLRLFIIVYRHNSRIIYENASRSNRAINVIIKNKKVIFQVCAVIGMFTVCMTPYTICFLTIGLVAPLSKSAITHLIASQYLAFAYPSINPLVYGYFMADTRHEIITLFRKMCGYSTEQKKPNHYSASQITGKLRSNSISINY
ncbi:Beta-4C adrenergic receptor [Trichoplax sp. H2]|nr:Beta-4C adrenergic receptor [Trichoplax sp. H2]|eukprot:RDD46293.1 Beta-4C adrenergic receptor [Trichoplax sp. H2]